MKQRSTLLLLVVEVIQGSREAEKKRIHLSRGIKMTMSVFDGAWRDYIAMT